MRCCDNPRHALLRNFPCGNWRCSYVISMSEKRSVGSFYDTPHTETIFHQNQLCVPDFCLRRNNSVKRYAKTSMKRQFWNNVSAPVHVALPTPLSLWLGTATALIEAWLSTYCLPFLLYLWWCYVLLWTHGDAICGNPSQKKALSNFGGNICDLCLDLLTARIFWYIKA